MALTVISGPVKADSRRYESWQALLNIRRKSFFGRVHLCGGESVTCQVKIENC